MEQCHRPVFLREVIELIRLVPGGVYLDLTFGEGGHSEALINSGAGKVVAFDRDNDALERYRKQANLARDHRLTLIHSRFSQLRDYVGNELFDGAVMDLGPSTAQLMEPARGFSFREEGPLDMRMDRSEERELSAILGQIRADELARALRTNTDLNKAEKVAERILSAFRLGKLATTLDLARLAGRGPGRRHPATVVFLALRMLVNRELDEIETGIPLAIDALKPGSRLAVITFHSSEDRTVKRVLRKMAGACVCGQSFCLCPREKRVCSVLKKPLVPAQLEVQSNPRARSAKLRCVEKAAGGG